MNELIINALTPICENTSYGWYNKSVDEVQVVFLEFADKEGNFADDEATTIDHYYQVSIFGKGDLDKMKADMKKALKSKGFIYQDGTDQIENLEDGSKLYHKATRWLYTEII